MTQSTNGLSLIWRRLKDKTSTGNLVVPSPYCSRSHVFLGMFNIKGEEIRVDELDFFSKKDQVQNLGPQRKACFRLCKQTIKMEICWGPEHCVTPGPVPLPSELFISEWVRLGE